MSRWRRVLRVIHRDAGYVVVGLTFVYALSGLAVNHIADWDPNFRQVQSTHELPVAFPARVASLEDTAAAESLGRAIVRELKLDGEVKDVYLVSDVELAITVGELNVQVRLDQHSAQVSGQSPRLFLRVANWLHLNRGKKAWTVFADGYAVLLLYLATSGLFLLPTKGAAAWRKAAWVSAGVAVPLGYLFLSGGP
jgi:uncharacterized protein